MKMKLMFEGEELFDIKPFKPKKEVSIHKEIPFKRKVKLTIVAPNGMRITFNKKDCKIIGNKLLPGVEDLAGLKINL